MNTITPRTGPGEGFLLQYDFPADSIPPLKGQPLDPKRYQEPGGPKDYDQQPGAKPTPTPPAPKKPDSDGGEPYKDWWQKG
jgi:hypothetical protein